MNDAVYGLLGQLIFDRPPGTSVNIEIEGLLIIILGLFYLAVSAAALMFILLNETVRRRVRVQDKLMFSECVLIICHNAVDIFRTFFADLIFMGTPVNAAVFYILLTLREVLFLLIVLYWMICADYSLYHSLDHIRRHYVRAALPIAVVVVLEIIQTSVNEFFYVPGETRWIDTVNNILFILRFLVELGYVIHAVLLVRRYERQMREPRFLRLDVFIIPFILGAVFHFFSGALTAVGALLSLVVMIRRDRFTDLKTGLFNRDYLTTLGSYWDRRGFADGSAIIISSLGNGAALAGILKDMRLQDSFPVMAEPDRYLIVTGEVRPSALEMAGKMISRSALRADPPFEVSINTALRGEGQSMREFCAALLQETYEMVERDKNIKKL